MNKWLEITVETSSESVDAVSEMLTRLGSNGTSVKDGNDVKQLPDYGFDLVITDRDKNFPKNGASVSGYFEEISNNKQLLEKINEEMEQLASYGLLEDYEVSAKEIFEEDWTNNWENYYHTQNITRFLRVVPEWEVDQTDDFHKDIILNPGVAFGTGSHETTQLALQALEMMMRSGESIIDVGSGSGVLAIAAGLLGARNIRAYDLDEAAVESAKKNIQLNNIEVPISVASNDLLKGLDEKADIIIANIVADILLELMSDAKALLNENGHFILSGIYENRKNDIIRNLEKNEFKIDLILQSKSWLAIVASHVEKLNN